jgi:CrcB protein
MDWRDVALDAALVALGGGLGAALRFGVSSALATKGFPWATLAVNLAGSLVIGALVLDHGMEHAARLFVVVGVLGGFTTLSTYSAETVDLWRTSHVGLAVANAVANGVGGPLCAFVGWKLAA